MILFVFEGKEREPRLFDTIQRLFFPKENTTIVCSFGNNNYELYRELSALDGAGDLVFLLQKRYEGALDNPFRDVGNASDFSEIYLFFDYDFHNGNLSLEQMNGQLAEMLSLFDDETDNGKLYINYPMIESIRYTKRLPDMDFYQYSVSREQCRNFKKLAADFSDYASLDFILLDDRKAPTEKKLESLKSNWEYLKAQNVCKANYLCHDCNALPEHKCDVSQNRIFEAQLKKYVAKETCEVAVLNAFPLFLYEYFK
jgi:hypothetical protein